MDDIGRVHEHQSSQELVDKVLDVIIGQVLSGIYHPVQVGLHQFCDDIDIGVTSPSFRTEQVNKSNNIVMLKKFYMMNDVTEELDLPYDSLSINKIIKGIDNLHG